ncbi:hypothetical protein TeGR_g1295, partial [Tetraparma gracilis]
MPLLTASTPRATRRSRQAAASAPAPAPSATPTRAAKPGRRARSKTPARKPKASPPPPPPPPPPSFIRRVASFVARLHLALFLALLAHNVPPHWSDLPFWARDVPAAPSRVPSPPPRAAAPTLESFLAQAPTHSYAPVFFGFYSYFGFLSSISPSSPPLGCTGSSAGAMAAVVACAGGIGEPIDEIASELAELDFTDVLDFYPPPFFCRFSLMRGLFFENLLEQFLRRLLPAAPSPIPFSALPLPTSVTAFDVLFDGLRSLSPFTTPSSSVSAAVRASATFPLLLSPV